MADPSLLIAFGDGAATARLQASPGLENDLRRLAVRFRSAQQVTPTAVELEIDDLITNLRALSQWPHRQDVCWDPRLKDLATSSVRDAQVVAERLASPTGSTAARSDDVPAMLGNGWTASLTDFQRRDIAKLLSLQHGANFSVPGAGKTRVGLAVFQALRHAGKAERLLIVGPKSSYEAWLTENGECLAPPLRMTIMNRDPDHVAEALIVNYERLAGALGSLAAWLDHRPAVLLLDEAHRMKLGAKGTYGASCLALGPHSRHRLILTGTPAPNGVTDLENLFSFVWPGTGRQKVIQAIGGSRNLAEASQKLRPLFTRTTKDELGLPKVQPAIRYLPLPPLHREIYDALIGNLSARAISAGDDLQEFGRIVVYMLMAATSPALLAVGATRNDPLAYRVPPLQVPAGAPLSSLMHNLPSYEMSPKYQEVLAIIQSNAKAGRKTLVWSTFIRSLNTLKEMLAAFSPALVHGGVEDRETEIGRFRNDPECMVLLSNAATLGEGISLHHDCHDAVYVDRDFAAGRFLQSLDRIHRLGLAPDTETRVTVLVSEGTIDEVVDQRLKLKLDFMGRILDDPAVRELADLEEEPTIGGGLDQADVQVLLESLRANST